MMKKEEKKLPKIGFYVTIFSFETPFFPSQKFDSLEISVRCEQSNA